MPIGTKRPTSVSVEEVRHQHEMISSRLNDLRARKAGWHTDCYGHRMQTSAFLAQDFAKFWSLDTSQTMNELRVMEKRVNEWLDQYLKEAGDWGIGFLRFEFDWKRLRNFTGLQLRLFVEQILWDRGYPWRNLATGFRPTP